MLKLDYFQQIKDQSSHQDAENFQQNKTNQALYNESIIQINDQFLRPSEVGIKEENERSKLILQFEILSKNNIGKNIIKSFFSYILNTNSNDLIEDFLVQSQNEVIQQRKIASKYFKAYQFNNHSLKKLISHKKYGKAFEFYLTFEAGNWLSKSKVKNKEEHLVYIDFLKLCCSNSDFQDWIVFYKKPKISKFNDRTLIPEQSTEERQKIQTLNEFYNL